jgi:hypothetical protein
VAVIDTQPFEFEKKPDEKETIGINFSRRIPSGVTISSYTVTAALYGNTADQIAAAGNLDAELDVSGSAVSNKTLSCLIDKGLDGYKYRVKFVVILSDTQRKTDYVYVTINDV